MTCAATADFAAVGLVHLLEMSTQAQLDDLDFGVIGFDDEGLVRCYNLFESKAAGLSRERVVGEPLFTVVAPCMNNFLVAQRFEDEPELDVTIDFVLTLRMRPTPVKLKLLKSSGVARRYLLVQR